MWLIKAALRNPYAVVCLALMIAFLGIFTIIVIPKDILPVFKAPAVQVLTYYPGMPASSVEKTITNRIERWVNQSPGCREVKSKSVPGVSVIRLYFREDIDPNAALTLTTSLAQGTLPTLPPNTLPPVTMPFDPTGSMPLGILTVNNNRLDEAQIKDWARVQVRNDLGAVKGAVAPVVIGGKDRTVLVYLDSQKMWTRKVSTLDVVNALRTGNILVTPGIAYTGPYQVLLDSNVMVDKVKELNRLPITMRPGENVYLEDIGHAEDASAIQTSRVRIKGRSQVYVPVYRQQGASSLAVSKGVKNHLEDMTKRLPAGTKLDYVMDQSTYVQESINSLIHEGVIGALLVSLMILLFLGNWRMTLIASLSIPLAILGSIICLYVFGNTINVMSLGGLALAIGPLVDDAIVVLENNHRHHTLGKSWLKASLDGCVEVMMPVLVATLTTCIVLAPVALMPGMGGFLFRPVTLAVTFAMFTSFVLSRTFVPMMCYKFLPEGHRASAGPGELAPHHHVEEASQNWFGRFHHRFEHWLTRVTARYEKALAWVLGRRSMVLLGIGLLFAGSLSLIVGIGKEFFPQVDAGQITMYVRAPSRYNLQGSTAKIRDVEKMISIFVSPRDRKMVVSELGLDPDWSAGYSDNSGQQDSTVRIQLTDERTVSSQEYAIQLRHLFHDAGGTDKHWQAFCLRQSDVVKFQLLRAFHRPTNSAKWKWVRDDPAYAPLLQENHFQKLLKQPLASALRWDPRLGQLLQDRRFPTLLTNPRFGELEFSFNTGGMVSTALNYGASSPINIQISGGTDAEAMSFAKKIRDKVKEVRGAADVRVLQRLDAPYLILDVNRDKAAELGLSAYDVIQQVVAALNSSVSINRNFWIDEHTGNQYFVAVQYPEDPTRTVEDTLNRTYANSRNQRSDVPLITLLNLRYTKAAVEVNHVSLYRVFNVQVNTENRDTYGVAADIRKILDTLPKPPKVNVDLKGEYARMTASWKNLGIGFLFAVVLVYLLLVSLFRAWLGPLIIMGTVPLALIGVMIILFVTKTTLNVQSQMGVIFLVGIVVSNGVLLVEFANKQRKLGAPVRKAILTAATIRFRPILMTFLATFLDLVPMAIGFGKGSEANVPLARAVVGGLLTSTCLTLFVIPIFYTFVYKDTREPEADVDKLLAEEEAREMALARGTGHHHGADLATPPAGAPDSPRPVMPSTDIEVHRPGH